MEKWQIKLQAEKDKQAQKIWEEEQRVARMNRAIAALEKSLDRDFPERISQRQAFLTVPKETAGADETLPAELPPACSSDTLLTSACISGAPPTSCEVRRGTVLDAGAPVKSVPDEPAPEPQTAVYAQSIPAPAQNVPQLPRPDRFQNKNTFMFHRCWWNAMSKLDPTDRGKALEALVQYGLGGNIPDNIKGDVADFIQYTRQNMEFDFERYVLYMKSHRGGQL